MKHPLFFFLCIISSFFGNNLLAQDNEVDPLEQLINTTYSMEGFQNRLANFLDHNETFNDNIKNKVFLKLLTQTLKEEALIQYARSIRGMFSEQFTKEEIESLTKLMSGPDGKLLQRLITLDQKVIDLQMKTYLYETVLETEKKANQEIDSILFYKEYPIALHGFMEGAFLTDNIQKDGKPVLIKRSKNTQTESYNDRELKYDIQWKNNSQYALTIKDKSLFKNQTVLANIYSVEDNNYNVIVKLPNGTFQKGKLIPQKQLPHSDQIQLYQTQLNDDYYNTTKTPFKEEAPLNAFKEKGGHQFFPFDPSYKVEAAVQVFDQQEEVAFPTSSADSTSYFRYALLKFKLDGKKYQLTAYTKDNQATGEISLFIPFRDQTSKKETYGGGRYINLNMDPLSKSLTLDFNKAYYPYCRYSEGYSCPYPPDENFLQTAIKAGIKD